MKKSYIKSGRFEAKVCLVNGLGEVVCELEPESGYYVIPRDKRLSILMDVGDEYHVEEIEFEVY